MCARAGYRNQAWLAFAALLAACAAPPASAPLPEAASGYQTKALQSASRFMVSAAHPLAVQGASVA